MLTVTDIEIIDLAPKLPNRKYSHLLPTVFTPKQMSFTINGTNNAVANAIRRTVLCELRVKHLHLEYEDIKTDEAFIIPEMIIKRLRMIPINQTVASDATFSINVTNTTAALIDVKSASIVDAGGKFAGLFNETFTLFTLHPGKYIRATNIRIKDEYGWREEYGGCVLACNATSLALDVEPINIYVKGQQGAISSSLANPRVWRVSFTTNGNMPPRAIVGAACDSIVERLRIIKELLWSVESNGDEHILTVNDESDTIGNLLMRGILELYPDIRAVVYSTSATGRILTVRIRCDDDVLSVLKAAITLLTETFGKIKEFIIL